MEEGCPKQLNEQGIPKTTQQKGDAPKQTNE